MSITRPTIITLFILGITFPLPFIVPVVGTFYLPAFYVVVTLPLCALLDGSTHFIYALVLYGTHAVAYIALGLAFVRGLNWCRLKLESTLYRQLLWAIVVISIAMAFFPLYGFEGGQKLHDIYAGIKCI